MPKDGEIHQCELLEYQGRYLQFVVADSEQIPTERRLFPETKWYHSRWELILPNESTGNGDVAILTHVLFCPCCGEDLRPDTVGCIAGRPQLAGILHQLKHTES